MSTAIVKNTKIIDFNEFSNKKFKIAYCIFS